MKGGVGAGAGVTAGPLGVIEIKNGHARFRPLDDNGLTAAVPAGIVGGIVMRVAQGLFKRVRR
jgi:uncharacterized spore protein YtfJ